MRLSDFDYELPKELIAQQPPAERDGARMLVILRNEGRFEDRSFRELPEFLRLGDCLVLNDSRVLPSRLRNGSIEIFLLHPVSEDAKIWRALVRPGRKLQPGVTVQFREGLSVVIVERGERGERIVRLECEGDVYAAIERAGHIPLPPYIRREDTAADRERYQTVFARERGSVAAPTAGLHFTQEVLNRCAGAGAEIAKVTLHVGLGTFQPIDRDDFEEHRLHSERYSVSPETWRAIEDAKRVVAVGTTAVRTIETASSEDRLSGSSELFIYPGYSFRRVGAMLTNFHLPRTSLLLLVCAFGGTELMLSAYRHAVRERYRFFSYGDCMFIV